LSSVLQDLEGRFRVVSSFTQRSGKLHGTADQLLSAQRTFEAQTAREVDALEASSGYSIDRAWMSALALHTQVTSKASGINYTHGRLIYTLLRRRLETWPSSKAGIVLDIGTARGFSSIVAARAISDSGLSLPVLSLDTVSHRLPRYWGTVDDLDGYPRSREALVSAFPESDGVLFIGQTSRTFLRNAKLPRTPFAFIDGAHTYSAVRLELLQIARSQQQGDLLLLDDAGPQYPGVGRAAESLGNYAQEDIDAGWSRTIRCLTRLT